MGVSYWLLVNSDIIYVYLVIGQLGDDKSDGYLTFNSDHYFMTTIYC